MSDLDPHAKDFLNRLSNNDHERQQLRLARARAEAAITNLGDAVDHLVRAADELIRMQRNRIDNVVAFPGVYPSFAPLPGATPRSGSD